MRLSTAAVALILALVAPVDALAEEVVGRWCDAQGSFARQMTILRMDDQSYVLESRYQGGEVGRDRLNLHGSTYWVVGSDFGDHFRVVSATGALQLSDTEGPIRVALPMSVQARCVNGR